MKSLDKIKTIFFDYDGTIHNSIYVYAPAFLKAYDYLVENGLAIKVNWSMAEISRWLGYNPQEMWNTFMPGLSNDLKQTCSSIISEEMKAQILKGAPVLYDGALEVLAYLKNKGYQLVFISNCKVYYMESHIKQFELNRYFEAFVCSEQYDFIPKYEILNMIKGEYPQEMVIIGDRQQDIEAGIKNKISTIGCSYGFAKEDELKEADIIISDIKELKNLL